jgi:hypothetical protein
VNVILVLYCILVSWVAYRFREQRDDYRRASEIRAQMIEETRRGKPPFLLDPGVEIVITPKP